MSRWLGAATLAWTVVWASATSTRVDGQTVGQPRTRGETRTSISPPTTPPPSSADIPEVSGVPSPPQRSRDTVAQGKLDVAKVLDSLRKDPEGMPSPAAAAVTIGDRVVPAGASASGPLAVVRGNLDVYGTVDGSAATVDGDLIVHEGGTVRGDALAVRGQVRLDGGTVGGEIRSVDGALGPVSGVAANRSPAAVTWRSIQIALGWLAVLAVVAIAVLVLASAPLDTVTDAVEAHFSRSFWTGVAGQAALLPALLLLVIALAISIVGLLLIPFAIVAFFLAAAGLATLGFLAVARVTGGIVLRSPSRPISERGSALRSLMGGVVAYAGLWIIAAAFTWAGSAGSVLRGIAFALTWVAVTTGFGAALLSRAGTRRLREPGRSGGTDEAPVWETPTPVTGVVAARRPTPPTQQSRP